MSRFPLDTAAGGPRGHAWRLTALMLAAALAFAPAGCKKKAAEEDTAAGVPELQGVSAQEKAWAETELARIWSDGEVVRRLNLCKPAAEDPSFYRDLMVLTRHPHRLAGYGRARTVTVAGKPVKVFGSAPGSLYASHYVAMRLKAMGVVVLTQEFPVAQPVTTECKLEVDGKVYGPGDGFHVMRANHLQAVVTPAGGITGRTVYAGSGKLNEYPEWPDGQIVVLDYSAGDRWLPAFAMGARAVIFVGADSPAPNPYHHLNFVANLPRFYVTEALAAKLELVSKPRQVTLKAACRWETLEGRNVIGVIRGTKARFKLTRHEAIMLSAPLDSLSEVPLLSPGARGAANCAALLAVAERLQRNPPRRHVIIAFLGGDACNHAGARALFGKLYRWKRAAQRTKLVTDTLDDRLDMFKAERTYIGEIQQVLAKGNVFKDEAKALDGHSNATRKLRDEAKALSGNIKDELYLLRSERNHYKRLLVALQKKRPRLEAQLKAAGLVGGEPSTPPAALADVDRDITDYQGILKDRLGRIAGLEAVDQVAWGNVERFLKKSTYPTQAKEKDVKQGIKNYGDILKKARHIPEQQRNALLQQFEQERQLWVDRIKGGALTRYQQLLKVTGELCETRQRELDRLVKYAEQGKDLSSAFGDQRAIIVLQLAINLSDESPRWGFVHGQDSQAVHKSKDNPGTYAGVVFRAIRKIAPQPDPKSGKKVLFDVRSVAEVGAARRYATGLFAHSGAAAGVFGVSNLAVMTPLGRRQRDGQPCDVVLRPGPGGKTRMVLNAANVIAPLDEVFGTVRKLAEAEEMSRHSGIGPHAFYTEFAFSNGRYTGARVQMLSGASATPDRPARGAFVIVMRRPGMVWEGARVDLAPPGFRPFCVVEGDSNGRLEVPPLSQDYYTNMLVVGATFNQRGLVEFVSTTRTSAFPQPLDKADTVLFRAVGITAVAFGHDRGATNTQALRAESTAPLNEGRSLVAESRNVLSVFCRDPTYRLKLFNNAGVVVLGNTYPGVKDPSVGIGRPIDPHQHWPVFEMTPEDLGRLTHARLATLKKHRILERSLERLQVEATEVHDRAKAVDPKDAEARLGKNAGASAILRSLYTPLRGVLDDLVVAVVFLLLLTIPFAYAMERLLIGSPHIYRQIGWFAIFFLVTFALLYVVNPAFAIAATPVIIFLAFAIILLSLLVIVIMTRKLQAEVGRLQGLSTSVHSADVSRLGTMMAAMHMGISTMRRRPIRTMLTAATVVLLTFTILTFASFSSSWGARRTYAGPISGPPRLLIRHPVWSRISEQTVDMLGGLLKGEAVTVPRYWVSQSAGEVESYKAANRTKEIVLADAKRDRVVPVDALLGLDPRDVERLTALTEVFGGGTEMLKGRGVFLTPPLLGQYGLDVKVGDEIIVDGVSCVLAGVVDVKKIQVYRMLEGSEVLPVDYQASGGGSAAGFQAQESLSADDLPEAESARFVRFDRDAVAIVSAELARQLGGRVASITIYPEKGVDIQKMGDRVAAVTRLPTYVGDKGGVHRLLFTTLTEASGWRDLLIPVVLGGLIIFATMLGSVSDREKEIYAFSALGLAPPHVASLFFAEAGVYSVVGGMGGYLLGQVVSTTVNRISVAFELRHLPTMNYSSMNAIVTLLIVMGTVLISTIYPAVKASRSANPGIQRSWKIGKPARDLYDLVFPFTVSAYDITGVVSFLREHFENFSDTALGVFATSSVHSFRTSEDMLGLRAEVALAPFDLGVSQRFALLAQPSEIEGIQEIRILLRRLSGTGGDWQRANRVFISELRKQLLIWRSVAPEVMEQYRQKTLQQWQELPVEDVTPETFGGQA